MAFGEEFGIRLSSEFIKDRAEQMRQSAREIRQLEVYSPPPHGVAEQSYVSAKDASASLGLYGDNQKIATSLITSLVDGKSMMEVAKEARGSGFNQSLIGELLRRGTRMRIEAEATQRPVLTPRFNKSLDDDRLMKANKRQRKKAAKKAAAGGGGGGGGGNKPPSGFSPVPKSSKGGYRKMEGHGYTYWYPGQGLSHEPHGEDHADVHHSHAKDLQGKADKAKAKLKPSPEVHKKYMELKERARESGIEITGKHPHGGTTIEEMDKIEKDLEHHISTKQVKAQVEGESDEGQSDEEQLADFSAQLDEMDSILNDVDTSGLSKEDTAKFEGFSGQIKDLRSQIEEAQKAQKKGKKKGGSGEEGEREDLTGMERIKNALWALRHIIIAMTIGTLTGGAQGGLRGMAIGSKKAMTETAQLKELGKAVKEAKTKKEKAKLAEAKAKVDKDKAKTDKDKAKVEEAKADVEEEKAKPKPKKKPKANKEWATSHQILNQIDELDDKEIKAEIHQREINPGFNHELGLEELKALKAEKAKRTKKRMQGWADKIVGKITGESKKSLYLDLSTDRLVLIKGGEAFTPEDVHAAADAEGVSWDDNLAFMDKCEKLTGKRHLDDMTEGELRTVASSLTKAGWSSIPRGRKGGQRKRGRDGKWEYRYGDPKRDKAHDASVSAFRTSGQRLSSNDEVFRLLSKERRKELYEATAMEIRPQAVAARLSDAFEHEKTEWKEAAKGARHFFTKPPPPTSGEKKAMFKVSLNALVAVLAAPAGPLAVISTLAGNFALHVVSKAFVSVLKAHLDPTDKLLILNDAVEVLSYFKSESMSDKKFLEAFVALVGKRVQEILRNDELSAAELKAITQGAIPPSLKKSIVKGGGPFIGKRGGKWANPEHTIPWHDTSGDSVGHKHATAAREVVAQFDGDHSATLEQLRKRGERKIFDAVSREMIPSNKIVEHLDAWTPTKPAAEHDMVTVHHTTDKDTAERMLRDGVIPQHKPVTQAQRDYQAGHHATFGPGAGVSGGIYVAKPGASDSYGQVTLKIRVPRAHLKVSPEQARHGVTDPHASLHTHDGAVVEHAVHHSQIELVKSDLAKGGPFIGPRGGKWADAKHTIPWKEDKKPRAKAKPKKKPKKKPPGSQLPADVRAKLKELGVAKLPAGDIAVETIKVDFTNPETTAVLKWRDGKNRIQSGYTPAFHKANAKKKWDRVMLFRDKFPAIKRALQSKLKKAKPGSTEHQGALIANIVALTGLRPGSTRSAKELEHHGASTLTPKHVKIDGSKVEIEYIGKSGKTNVATIRNKAVADALGGYMRGKKGNQPLFNTKALVAARESLPDGALLKDLRTIVGTDTAERVLNSRVVPPPLTGDKKKDKRLLAKALKEATKIVAEVLNNTPAVAASTYVHPEVFKKWALDKAGADPSLFEEV